MELILVALVVGAGVGHKMGWWTVPLLNYVPFMNNASDE